MSAWMPAGIRFTPLVCLTFAACMGGGGPGPDPDPDPVDIDGSVPLPDAGPPSPDAPPMVEELPPLGDGVGTLSGASVPGRIDGTRGIARFSNPVNVVSDGAGGLVVCDFDNSTLRRVSADGTASSPFTLPTGFARPFGAVRTGDTLFVQTDRSTAGTPTGALWRVSLTNNSVALVKDAFGRYRGLGVLSDGRLVGAEYLQGIIAIIDPATGNATPLITGLTTPYDIVVLPTDDVVFADYGGHAVRKVSPDGTVHTLADTGFTTPQGLALADDGTIYVSDPGAAKIFAIAPVTYEVSTAAGTGTPGYLDDADPLAAKLFGLEGIDVDADYLYVADGSGGEDVPYHRVRRIKR
jgi:sugar lactone lactonase YvrE